MIENDIYLYDINSRLCTHEPLSKFTFETRHILSVALKKKTLFFLTIDVKTMEMSIISEVEQFIGRILAACWQEMTGHNILGKQTCKREHRIR